MPITRVIVPVDFSDTSLAAVSTGRALAARAGIPAEIMSVTAPTYTNTTVAALRTVAAEHGGDLAVRAVTAIDDDIEGTLVAEVLASPAAIWCVGSHGRTALGELMFGSVSADLVREAEVPLVVVGPHAGHRAGATHLAVALDGSDLSETILPAAVAVATALGLQLRLLQVGLDGVPSDSNESAYLARVAQRLDHHTAIDFDTLHGDVDEALRTYLATNDDIALLAMTTRGVPAGARLSVPSTAMRVMRHAPVPVLMLHPPTTAPVVASAPVPGEEPLGDERLRVVVGIDSLAASRPALIAAAAEAERRGAILQILHTWQIPVGPGSMYGYPIWPDLTAVRQGALDEAEATRAAVAADHPDLVIETIVAEGGAANAIARQSDGAALMVLGRHHHNLASRLVLGSVVESVVQRIDCPLLVVPCDEPVAP